MGAMIHLGKHRPDDVGEVPVQLPCYACPQRRPVLFHKLQQVAVGRNEWRKVEVREASLRNMERWDPVRMEGRGGRRGRRHSLRQCAGRLKPVPGDGKRIERQEFPRQPGA